MQGDLFLPATIVVVDADRTFVNQLQAILTEAGHSVHGVVGRDEAVQMFESLREPPEIAIIDFLVPGTTGPELIGFVKLRLPSTAVIATVPGEDPDLSNFAAQTGADLVVRRPETGQPPHPGTWIRTVREILEKRRGSAA